MILIVIAVIFQQKTTYMTGYYNGHINNAKIFDTDNDISDQKTADMICRLNSSINKLIVYLKHKYPNDNRVRTLIREYDDDDIQESNTTYIVNKGDKIHVKIRHIDGKLYSYNLLIFVIIHELAHMISPNYIVGKYHDSQFYEYNRWLLNKAIECKIYKYHDYKLFPIMYNNILINKNII